MKVFISGGCKNGKSSFAQTLAVKLADGGKLYYVATMIPRDNEDLDRVRRHVEDRAGMGFETLEQGRDILSCLTESVDTNGSFLVDSVTALLENEMFSDQLDIDSMAESVERCKADLLAFASNISNGVFVSDYIYADAARYDAFTEAYRQGLARIDCALAELCDVVCELCEGNLIIHKGKL